MAIVGYYKEMTEAWEINYGLTHSTARRVFHDDTTVIGSLPWHGDVLNYLKPGQVAATRSLRFYVENVRITKFGGHPDKQKYEVTYSTRIPEPGNNPEDTYVRNGQIGAEMITLNETETAATYKWEDGKAVNQKIGIQTGVGSFTIERRSSSSTLPKENIRKNYLGKINSKEFEDYPANTVLFEGISYNQFTNEDSQIRYRVVFSFRIREDSWLKLFRESKAAWETVTPSMYSEADLNDLLKGTFL